MYRAPRYETCQYECCGKPNPPGRRVYCSPDCAAFAQYDRNRAMREEHAAKSPRVFKCQRCGATGVASRRGVLPTWCRAHRKAYQRK